MLNHWDNLDGHVERGYAGQSIWDWHKLPDYLDPRYTDYARASASIGINGTVLTNVNANAHQPDADYLEKAAALAGRVPSVRHPRVSHGALQRADRDRRPQDRRSARPGGARVVASEGRRDLPLHSRLRRLPGQGQLRRPARSAGLRPHPRRRRQHAGRRAGAARRHRDVARVRLLERGAGRPRQAGVHRIRAARRQVPRQRDGAGEERRDRLPAARAVPSAVRRDAEDAADDGVPDHQGVPGLRHAPRLSRADVRRGAATRTRR